MLDHSYAHLVKNIKSKVKYIPSDAQEVLGEVACNWIRNNYQWFYDYFEYA